MTKLTIQEDSLVHKYFIRTIDKNYYKRGYCPATYIPTLSEKQLLTLLENKEDLLVFKRERGYVGDLSLGGYENYINTARKALRQPSIRDRVTVENMLLAISCILLIPIVAIVAAKVLGIGILIIGTLCAISIPYLLLFMVSERSRCKEFVTPMFYAISGTIILFLFSWIINSTGDFGEGWKDIIRHCGRYC